MKLKDKRTTVLKEFKYKQFRAEFILWAVRWYCQFPISYRDLVIMARERDLSVTHTTRIDETYIKIKGEWKYLYRAVDSDGHTLDWMLSAKRNKQAAKRFFKNLIGNLHCRAPRVINVDKAKSFPPAFDESRNENVIPITTKLRRQKYMNNIQEHDHRFTKRRVRQSQWFQSFYTAKWTIAGYETMHMIRKGQVRNLARNDIKGHIQFINNLFGIAA